MSSRRLTDLHPELEPLALGFLNACEIDGLDILVTCTYRSEEEQDALYAQGRTAPGEIVTMARPGQSDHNFRIDGKPASKAFDIVPLNNGKAAWDIHDPLWRRIAKIWSRGFNSERYYLDWYGRPDAKFEDFSHFCLKEFLA